MIDFQEEKKPQIDFQLDFQEEDSGPGKYSPNSVKRLYEKYKKEAQQRASRTSIPGSEAYDKTPIRSYEEFEADLKKQDKERYIGAAEAALSVLSGIPATVVASVGGLNEFLGGKGGKAAEERFLEIMEGITYSPRTDAGQRYIETIGHAAQALPPVGAYVNAARVGRAKAPVAEKPKATIPGPKEAPKIDFVQDPGAGAFDKIVESQISGAQEPIRPYVTPMESVVQGIDAERARRTQMELEARQKQLEQDVARQTRLDMNAAERARQEQAPIPGLEAARALEIEESIAKTQELNKRGQQMSIVEDYGNNDPMARMPNMRVDENGMPIRADLSMEAQNLQNPLQRNLWGDELPVKTGDNGIPMTQALDQMPPGALRDTAISQLSGQQLPADFALGGGIARNQLGAIDLNAISDAFKRLSAGEIDGNQYINAFRGAFTPGEMDRIWNSIYSPKPREAVVLLSPDEFHALAAPRFSPNSPDSVSKRESIRKGLASEKGLTDLPQLWFEKDGDTARVVNHEGRHRMDVFKEMGVERVPVLVRDMRGPITPENLPKLMRPEDALNDLQDVSFPEVVSAYQKPMARASERGVIDFNVLAEPFKRLMHLGADDPAVKQAAQVVERETKRAALANKIDGLRGYRVDIDTPEKLIAAAPYSKDLTATQKFNTIWRPGLRVNTINSNNPLLKFANTVIQEAWTTAENFSRKYITDNQTGIATTLRKLSNDETVEVHELLKAGDKYQRRYTADELRKNNFNENQIKFIEQVYKMEDIKYEVWNDKRMAAGLDPLKYREGHWPGIFKGDYRTLVLDKDGSVIGYIGTDTKWTQKKVRDEILKKYPEAKFTDMKRTSLGGHAVKGDIFSGLRDLMQVLSKTDPRFKDIMDITERTVAQKADSLFGAELHARDKKGIFGSEGKKFWKNDHDNATEALKAYFEYWEEGMVSHHMIPVEAQLHSVMQNPALDHMPRAKEYVNDYVKGMTGRSLSREGEALNTLIDAPFKLIGVGPSVPRQLVNQFTKRMGQLTQGFMNIPYTAMQFLQIPQTAWPLMQRTARELGINPAQVAQSHAYAVNAGFKMMQEKFLGKADVTPEMQAMLDYAESKGLLTFSEFEDVYQVTQGKIAQTADTVVDWNRRLSEQSTRPFVFFTFVDLLRKGGVPENEVMGMAYNLTQDSMVDYSLRERALMFQKMGVLGQTAGNLQQFSLSYMDQMARWTKEAAKGNPGPLLLGMTVLMTYAGLQGLPFYTTANNIVEEITDKFFGDKKSINTIVAENAPQWLKTDVVQYGLLSSWSGYNISGRLGMADVVPESVVDAISPYAGTAGKMATSLYDLAKHRDSLAASTAARQWAPASLRGVVENKLLTSPEGYTINKEGQFDYPRTPQDIQARKYGLTSLEEAKSKQTMWQGHESALADEDRVAKVGSNMIRRIFSGGQIYLNSERFKNDMQEYTSRGGDPEQFVRNLEKAAVDRQLTTKQRLGGLDPQTLAALRRFIKINKEPMNGE